MAEQIVVMDNGCMCCTIRGDLEKGLQSIMDKMKEGSHIDEIIIETIFRIKAILAVKGHPYKHVFHAVMDISDEDDAGPWAEGEKKISKIVFIGKGLDRTFIQKGWEEIFDKPPQ